MSSRRFTTVVVYLIGSLAVSAAALAICLLAGLAVFAAATPMNDRGAGAASTKIVAQDTASDGGSGASYAAGNGDGKGDSEKGVVNGDGGNGGGDDCGDDASTANINTDAADACPRGYCCRSLLRLGPDNKDHAACFALRTLLEGPSFCDKCRGAAAAST